MTYSEPSPTLRAILRDLEKRERTLTFRAIEHPFGYTGEDRVELSNLESRGGAASVLNPSVSRRSASSRLSR